MTIKSSLIRCAAVLFITAGGSALAACQRTPADAAAVSAPQQVNATNIVRSTLSDEATSASGAATSSSPTPCYNLTVTAGASIGQAPTCLAVPSPPPGVSLAPAAFVDSRKVRINADSVTPLANGAGCDPNADVCVTYSGPYFSNGFWDLCSGLSVCTSQTGGAGVNCGNPAVAKLYPTNCKLSTYTLAYSGGKAHAGASCWGSPGTIGAFVGGGSTVAFQIYDVTQIQQDVTFNNNTFGYRNVGWIYKTATGAEYWQATPRTTIGVSAGVLMFSASLTYDPSNVIVQINPIAASMLFNVMNTVAITVANGSGVYHSKGCFTADWNGTS